MKFSEYAIDDGLKKSLEKQGYKKPTDIQFRAIPAILKGEDLLAIAQTGTGKTAAFAIPLIHKIHLKRKLKIKQAVRCLVMVPTHELAQQIERVFIHLSKHCKVNTVSLYGGVERDPQSDKLAKGADVVIATPGRLFDLAKRQVLDLRQVEYLVLDEADQMLNLGFIDDIKELMRFVPKNRQTLFFSATINEELKKLANAMVKQAVRIHLSPKNPVAKNIDHSVAHIKMDDKRFFLADFIEQRPQGKVMVFVRTKVRAERVKKALERANINSLVLHGDLTQQERDQALADFRAGRERLLIATDVSARGIDIPDIDFVINYDLPEDAHQYVHRVGRTGRGRNKGQAISFCAEQEIKLLEQIEEELGQAIPQLEISKSDYQITLEDNVLNQDEDWKTLLRQDAAEEEKWQKKKKKRRK